MDTYLNNDFSLNQGQGAEFGEYSATKSGQNSQPNFDSSMEINLNENKGYEDYQKTTNEIGLDSEYAPAEGDFLQTADAGETDFKTSTGIEGQYESSFDVLQATSSAEGKYEYGEYQSTNNMEGGGFSVDDNAFKSNDPIIDPQFNLGDFQTTETTTNGLDNQYDILQATSSGEGEAQFGEYKATTNNEGISSAEDLINTNDFTTSTPIIDINQNTENTQGFDINAYQTTDTTEVNTENLAISNPVNDANTGFDFGEYQTTEQTTEQTAETTSNLQNLNEILHQSIEPEEGATGGYTEPTQLVDTDTLNENTQNFDFGEYKTTNIDTNTGFDATAFTTNEPQTTDTTEQNFDFNNFDFGNQQTTTTTTTTETNNYQQTEPTFQTNIESSPEFDINQYLTSTPTTESTTINTTNTTNVPPVNTGIDMDIDKLLSTQNYGTGETISEYQTNTQESPQIIETNNEPLPIQPINTEIINEASIPVQTTTQIINQQEPIVDTGLTLGNLESTPKLDTNEIFGKTENNQDFSIDELISSSPSIPVSVDRPVCLPQTTIPKPVPIPTEIPMPQATIPKTEQITIPPITTTTTAPATLAEPIIPTNLETGATFGEYKTITNNVNNIQPTFTPPVQTLTTIPTPVTTQIPQPIPPPVPRKIVKVPKIKKVFVPKIKKVYVPSKKKIYIKRSSSVPSMIGRGVEYAQSPFAPQAQIVRVPSATSISVPKTIPYAQNTLVHPPMPITQVPTQAVIPRPIPYAQNSIPVVTQPAVPVQTTVVPRPIPYSQNSIPVVTQPVVPVQPPVAVPRPIPYAQKSVTVVPPPTVPVQVPAIVPRPIPYAQNSIPVVPSQVVPAQTPVVIPRQIPYSQNSIPVITQPAVPVQVPAVVPQVATPTVIPVQTPAVVPGPVPYSQNSVPVVTPPVVQAPSTPITTLQTLPVQTIPITAAKPPLPTVQNMIQTSAVAPSQPQIVQTPMPVASVLGVPNTVNTTVPIQPVIPLPVKSIDSQVVQPITQITPPPQTIIGQPLNITPVNQIINRAGMPTTLGMNRPAGYSSSTYRPNGLRNNIMPYQRVGGYRNTNVGNMNRPLQYGSRTYNARRL